MEYFPLRRYEAFDPTWSKIFYEYGTLGTALYLAFFAAAVSRGWRPLIWPLTITFFLLGGYLATPFIVSLVAGLLAWPDRDSRAP